MNRLLWAMITVLVIILLVFIVYIFGFDSGQNSSVEVIEQPESVEQTEPVNFYNGGVITSTDNTNWYLEYTRDNQNMKTRLQFTIGAACTRNRITVDCSKFDFKPNEIVMVNGEKVGDVINVDALDVTVNQPVPSSADTFKETSEYGFFGTITLNGYLEIQRRVCNEGEMCGETVDYASFVFTNTDNEAIKKFTGTQNGNSFVAGNKVGIGCRQADKPRIYYENDADKGYITGQIVGDDYTKLIASTKEKPVQITMTREIYTGGRGAPDCYSHFRNFDVL